MPTKYSLIHFNFQCRIYAHFLLPSFTLHISRPALTQVTEAAEAEAGGCIMLSYNNSQLMSLTLKEPAVPISPL